MTHIAVEPTQSFFSPFIWSYKTILYLCLGAISSVLGTALVVPTNSATSPPPGGVKLQIVSFGDSLSDVGTYSPFAGEVFSGGLFTTNPGKVWTQLVAAYYGDDLKPAFVGGFGQPLTPAGGLGFAEGGSRVSRQPGIGHAQAGTPDADFALLTTTPVADQVDQFLSRYGAFNPDQLVLINGGANDLLINLENAQTNPLKLPGAFIDADNAAIDLANVADKVIHAGAKHVVLLDLADLGLSPAGVAGNQSVLITSIIRTFNDTLKSTLLVKGDLNKVILVDEFTFLDKVIAHFQDYGFTTSNTGSACDSQAEIALATRLNLINPGVFSDSLYCSPQTLVAPNSDQTFIFADKMRPSSHYSALLAKFVEQQIAASGLGK